MKSGLAKTFPTGGVPRDRRGRVAHKGRNLPDFGGTRLEDEGFGDDTPRIGLQFERERERQFLESLRYFLVFFFSCEQRLTTHYRSPDIEPAARHDSGGWGLAAAQIETSKADEEDDEPSDWEQVHVRTFVDSTGIKSPSANLGERRRRMT
jgi:hypothetical protein